MMKAPISKENSTTNRKHKNATKTSITQRLRADCGRSVRVTTAVQLVWLNQSTVNQPEVTLIKMLSSLRRRGQGPSCSQNRRRRESAQLLMKSLDKAVEELRPKTRSRPLDDKMYGSRLVPHEIII